MYEKLPGCLWLAVAILTSWHLVAQTDTRGEIQLHYQRAQDAMNANELEKAADEFREILRLDPKRAEAHANLGVIAYSQGNYPEAIKSFSAALNLNPSLWDAQAFLGLSEIRVGRMQDAKALLEKSVGHIQNRNLSIEAGTELITIDQESNTLERAVAVVQDLLQSNPNDPNVLYIAYRTYSDLAAHAVATLSKVAPQSARMHQILAQAAASQDDVPGAVAEYRKVLQTNPRMAGIHYELGRAILASSQEESARQEAQKDFEAELAINPMDASSEYELGEVYSLRSDMKQAVEHYSRALKLRPDLVEAHVALAKLLTDMGRPTEALPHLLEAERLDPDNETAHYKLAQAYRESGQDQEAARELALFNKLRDSHIPTRTISK